MAVIEVEGLTKRFGSTLAVDDLSFEVERGTVTGYLGPNGAGKTTTLRVLLGLVAPTAGAARINGRAYRDLSDPTRTAGAVLESSSFHPGRAARNHLVMHALACGIPSERVDEVLELVDLTGVARQRVGGFSLGMRQRLALATALLGDPEVLILDEPANGLDPEGVRWLRELIRSRAEDGGTVLVSSHLLAEVAQTVDRVVILDRGRLVTQSSLDELVEGTAGHTVRVRTSRPEELQRAVAARDGAKVTVTGSDRLEIVGWTPEQVGVLAAELRIPIFESTTEADNLEDVFLKLTETADGHFPTPQEAP